MVSDRSEADNRWKQVEDLFFAAADLPEDERPPSSTAPARTIPNCAARPNRYSPPKAAHT